MQTKLNSLTTLTSQLSSAQTRSATLLDSQWSCLCVIAKQVSLNFVSWESGFTELQVSCSKHKKKECKWLLVNRSCLYALAWRLSSTLFFTIFHTWMIPSLDAVANKCPSTYLQTQAPRILEGTKMMICSSNEIANLTETKPFVEF